MKLLVAPALLLAVAASAFAQTPSEQPSPSLRAQSVTRIQRACPNISANLSEESLLAAIADCLDRLSPQNAPHVASLSGVSLVPSGIGRLMVRELHGQKIFYPDPALTPGKLSVRDTNTVCDPDFTTKSVRM